MHQASRRNRNRNQHWSVKDKDKDFLPLGIFSSSSGEKMTSRVDENANDTWEPCWETVIVRIAGANLLIPSALLQKRPGSNFPQSRLLTGLKAKGTYREHPDLIGLNANGARREARWGVARRGESADLNNGEMNWSKHRLEFQRFGFIPKHHEGRVKISKTSNQREEHFYKCSTKSERIAASKPVLVAKM